MLSPIARAVNTLFTDALSAGASDIHVEPQAVDLLVRLRVEGNLVEATRIPDSLRLSVVSQLKLIGRLDIAEERRPQVGRARLRFGDRGIDIRVSSVPAQFGETVVIRLLNSGASPLPLDQMLFSTRNLDAFERLLRHPQGLVIVTGPTGSGTTTTLYAALNYLKSPTKNIVTVEYPIEFHMAGITQMQVQPTAGVTFADGLRSILRQDPDVILVGELRDRETAHIAIEATQAGDLLLAGLRTNDAATSIPRLLDLGVDPHQLTSSLTGVLAQRLARRVCPSCAVYSKPPAQAVADLGLESVLYAGCEWLTGQGCPQCRGTGYQGRVAIHELLEPNDEIRDLVSRRAPDHLIRDAAKRHGMVTLLDDGIAKAAEGFTTLEEVLRVVPCFPASRGDDLFTSKSAGGPRHATVASGSPTPVNPGAAACRAILVIEDDADTQALLRLILEEKGYEVTTAADGIDALLALGKRRFDLILSDINMPNMDGIALLEAKAQKGIATPIVFLSADTGADRERECLALGAADYLSKPIKKDVLLLRLKRALQ
jgi:type II secretory ATPase GspE/PulE/Tfp pilus assembly ATPase PilB-like protein